MSDQPIGMFDSGLGGLSVWREVVKQIPGESVVYLADSANCPYGPRPEQEIQLLCEKNVEFLLSKRCKLIVVACNTATSAAITHLREKYPVPFIGMEPAVKPAALHTKTGNIGILATQGTLNGKLFNETKKRFAENVNVHLQVGHGLVELVEKGLNESPEAEEALGRYIRPMLENNADHIVLGCTHYPFLSGLICKIAGDRVTIIDPAPAVALQTKRKVEEFDLSAPPEAAALHSFFTTGDARLMEEFAHRTLHLYIQAEKIPVSV
jgi:glutamate racemase